MPRILGLLGAIMATICLNPVKASAGLVDFEPQGVGHGGQFTGSQVLPLTIGNAPFTGGELLLGETGFSSDHTAVYASYSIASRNYANPIRIVFSSPVRAVSLLVTNLTGGTYLVADDAGDAVSQVIAPGFESTFVLAGVDISSVLITSAGRGWIASLGVSLGLVAAGIRRSRKPLYLRVRGC